jgi:hypothetical protein
MPLHKYLTASLFLSILFSRTFGQQIDNDVTKKTDSIRSNKQTSFTTSLLPEVLQTAISNGILSGSNTGLKVNTTLFGLQKLFNPKVAIDTNYIRETFARNLAFGGALDINSSNQLNGWQSFLQLAIFNNRDISRIDDKYLNAKLRARKSQIRMEDSLLIMDLSDKLAMPIEQALRNESISKAGFDSLTSVMSKFIGAEDETAFNNIQQAVRPYLKKVLMILPSLRNIIKRRLC